AGGRDPESEVLDRRRAGPGLPALRGSALLHGSDLADRLDIERRRCHMGSTWRSNVLCSLCLALLWAMPAYAAPGDPRFLQGTIEWPAVLTGEPVVIVRGDDGHVYSADVDGARRQG